VAALIAAAALSACGKDAPKTQKPSPTPTPTPVHTPAPSTSVVEGNGELAVGITEPNPNFIRPEGVVPPEFDRWRPELRKMRPTYYRLAVDWPGIASPDGAQLDFAKGNAGCMRDIGPCASFNGVRDQLHALAAAQKAAGGDRWQVMVVPSGTPDQLAGPATGCERGGTLPRSRPPTAAGLAAYERLIAKLLDEAKAVGVELRYWSPWNEPNHPFFISPQRTRCEASAPSAAVGAYARIARAMMHALDRAPGEQEMVLGETAGLLERKSGYTDVRQFVRKLPNDVVCASRIYGQHGYVGGPDPVDDLAAALRSHGCRETHQIWITETGVGAPRRGEDRRHSGAAQRRACRNMRKRLNRWYEDPRVTAAFQYTFREDDRFATGLVTTDLTQAYPALKEWQGWGARETPTERPPRAGCAG
jgi:hypothetical protein